MPYVWKAPEKFLTYRGVNIYHAYKDELSDMPIEFWYSTCREESPGSPYEFDVRDLPGYRGGCSTADREEDKRVIKAAIAAGLLQQDTPWMEEPGD
jgi:hypothetical protein